MLLDANKMLGHRGISHWLGSEISSDCKPSQSRAISVNIMPLRLEIPSLHWKSELNLVHTEGSAQAQLRAQLRIFWAEPWAEPVWNALIIYHPGHRDLVEHRIKFHTNFRHRRRCWGLMGRGWASRGRGCTSRRLALIGCWQDEWLKVAFQVAGHHGCSHRWTGGCRSSHHRASHHCWVRGHNCHKHNI